MPDVGEDNDFARVDVTERDVAPRAFGRDRKSSPMLLLIFTFYGTPVRERLSMLPDTESSSSSTGPIGSPAGPAPTLAS